MRVRVVRDAGGSADGSGALVFDKTLFPYRAGLVVEDGFPSTRHLRELGGPAGCTCVSRPDGEPGRLLPLCLASSCRIGACYRPSR